MLKKKKNNGNIYLQGAANEEQNVIIISLPKQLKQWKIRNNPANSDLHNENKPKVHTAANSLPLDSTPQFPN